MKSKQKRVFIGCSSKEKIDSKYFSLAKEVSSLFSRNGYNLTFGASSFGMMGWCYQTFIENKKEVSSHTVSKYVNDLNNLKNSSKYIYDTTFERTKQLYEEADIIVFLPGGTGTLAEIFSILEENRTTNFPKKVILYNYENYYNQLLSVIDCCVKNDFNDMTIYNYFDIVKSNDELIEVLKIK